MMLQPAVTLVHKGAMPIALHAVRSFSRHFRTTHQLSIHTDGSPNLEDENHLREAATGIEVEIIRPEDRAPVIHQKLLQFPNIRKLLNGLGYNAKLEVPMFVKPPFFYFDSDIVWLRPVDDLKPTTAPNAFSTESWTWYNGVANDQLWIDARTPRRVNSGFFFVGQEFPFERMEQMLIHGMFDSDRRYNTDQEIMAYLFKDMELYHPDDLKRSRRNVIYDIASDPSAALHFPGGMWKPHLEQLDRMTQENRPPLSLRYQNPVPIDRLELFRMRMTVKACDSPCFRHLFRGLRAIRKIASKS